MLTIPTEPVGLRDKTRARLEQFPEEGRETVRDAKFLAYFLWRYWGEELRAEGTARREFLAISQGYSQEIHLWVVGERPWEQCASGLAGRVRRRVGYRGPDAVGGDEDNSQNEKLVSTGVCG